jgi:hypothetical protein
MVGTRLENGRSPAVDLPAGIEDSPLAVLHRIRQPVQRPRPGERCEMCTAEIGEPHSHVVNLETRALLCSCRPCYLLFTERGAAGGRYRSVPERFAVLRGFSLSGMQWDALQIPVGVAFFFYNSNLGEMAAFYPSPAGATESLLPLGAWEEIAASHQGLRSVEPDVEAVLIRLGREHDDRECFIVPIDSCYELVGHLRKLWRGFDGGSDARAAMDQYFEGIRAHARPIEPGTADG